MQDHKSSPESSILSVLAAILVGFFPFSTINFQTIKTETLSSKEKTSNHLISLMIYQIGACMESFSGFIMSIRCSAIKRSNLWTLGFDHWSKGFNSRPPRAQVNSILFPPSISFRFHSIVLTSSTIRHLPLTI